MRSYSDLVIPLILGMVVVASFLFVGKFKGQAHDLDEITLALSPLHNVLGYGSTIGCDSRTARTETGGYVSNALVPIVAVSTDNMDTTLVVFNTGASDSAVIAALKGKQLLWERRSEHYHFILTTQQ